MAKSKRNQVKIRKILERRGYKDGKVPRGKWLITLNPKPKVVKILPKIFG